MSPCVYRACACTTCFLRVCRVCVLCIVPRACVCTAWCAGVWCAMRVCVRVCVRVRARACGVRVCAQVGVRLSDGTRSRVPITMLQQGRCRLQHQQ